MDAGAEKENGEAAPPAAAKKEPPSKAVKIRRSIRDTLRHRDSAMRSAEVAL